MTLLICVFAAIIATIKWYKRENDDMRLGILRFMFWGASIMWLVDAVFEYAELRADYFTPAAADMLNDTFLGLSVVALGLIIWVIRLLILDPRGVIRGALFRKTEEFYIVIIQPMLLLTKITTKTTTIEIVNVIIADKRKFPQVKDGI